MGGPTVLPFPSFNTLSQSEPGVGEGEPSAPKRTLGPTVMGLMEDQLRVAAPPVQQIWLPPMPAALTLDAAAGPIQVGHRGMQLAGAAGPLRVPLGLLDDPARQWQGRWYLDLTVAAGRAALIGGPQSGKTTRCAHWRCRWR